jgi:hypothetical protein
MVSHGNRDREKVGLRTDSSTAPFGTIRLLLSFSVLLKLRFSSINIYGAYLQAEPPTRDIFVRPHPGWAPSGIVWKIIRPAYGLWKAVVYGNCVELFDFEACLRVREFQFTRGSALYRE